MNKSPRLDIYFWLLVILILLFTIGGLVFSWRYSQVWMATLWQTCRNGLHYLAAPGELARQLIIPLVILLGLTQAGISMVRQIRATHRLTRLFLPLREAPPDDLSKMLEAHKLTPEDVVFLNLDSIHVFCLGFWRPRIWLTAELIDLLSNEELAAVLAHEVHHYRQRDPLRLLISRASRSAFFFLPLMGDLARAAQLQQEVAADQAAIAHLGSDLPLLCALQKLLQRNVNEAELSAAAAYNPFTVTEARLQRLIYTAPPIFWRKSLSRSLINLVIILVFSGAIVLPSVQPTAPQEEIGSCHTLDSTNNAPDEFPLLNYSSPKILDTPRHLTSL